MNWKVVFSDAVFVVIGLALAKILARWIAARGVNISAGDPPTA